MNENYRVGGYVKLAKLWERKRDEAIQLHEQYYEEMFKSTPDMELVDVYIDITGNKNIWKRPGMLQLIKDCQNKKVNCIATQTKAYLAANTEDFFFLIYYLFTMPSRVDLVTEDADYNINTIVNAEHQREELLAAAKKYISVEPARYLEWVNKIADKLSMME